MREYHKIQTVYKRDPENGFKTLLEGEFALPEFRYLKDNQWLFTEKVDGTNIRVIFGGEDNPNITFGGKTGNAQIPTPLLNNLNEMFLGKIAEFKEKFSDGVCLYGEGYGAKIQKGGGNYRQDQDFVLFDVKVGDWWLERPNVREIAQMLDVGYIPSLGGGTLAEMVEMAKAGFKSTWGDFEAEGIVARPLVVLKTRNGGRIITKIKCKDFK